MVQDFKLAFRQLRKSPGFFAIAVLTLAVAIGVNSASFALVNTLVFRPVVPHRPGEVVSVYGAWKDARQDYRPFSFREYRALRESNQVFADVAAVKALPVGIGRGEGIQRSVAVVTSENFFALAGTQPAAGRFFSASECQPEADIPVAVASHELWRRLGSPAAFVGSTVQVNGRPYTVVGIGQAGFSGLHAIIAPDLWLPLGVYTRLGAPAMADGNDATAGRLDGPGNHPFNLLARLRPGLSIDAAKGRLSVLAARLTEAGRERDSQIQAPSRFSITTRPVNASPTALFGALLMAMAGVVLLVACLNLANMMLARGAARTREIAVRLALGASRARIVRGLMCEGLLLAAAGGAGGLLLAAWSNDLLARSLSGLFLAMSLPTALGLGAPDLRVVAGTFALCLVATVLFGLGPALHASKAAVAQELKQEAGEPGRGGGAARFFAPKHLLVMAQIALSLVLLFSTGLFLRGAANAGAVVLGFQPQGGVVSELDFSLRAGDEAAARRSMARVLERARALPEVRAAAFATMVPYGNTTFSRRVAPAAQAPAPSGTAAAPGTSGLYTAITPGYFTAVGVGLVRGRDFTAREAETGEAPAVAIVDELMAAALFPGGDALGKRIRYTQPPRDGSPAELEVVGIVKGHRHDVFSGKPQRRLFVPLAQGYRGNVFLHVRLAARERSAALAFVATLRQALRDVDPALPMIRILPFPDLIEANVELWLVRLAAVVFGVFGAVALLLAVVGVYGVKSHAVSRRRREIGIRMALGAYSRQVFSLVIKQGVLQTALALAVGSLLALGAGRVLGRMLYQVDPVDPLVLLIASVVLLAASLLACVLPARRATRVSPMTALRAD